MNKFSSVEEEVTIKKCSLNERNRYMRSILYVSQSLKMNQILQTLVFAEKEGMT